MSWHIHLISKYTYNRLQLVTQCVLYFYSNTRICSSGRVFENWENTAAGNSTWCSQISAGTITLQQLRNHKATQWLYENQNSS